jgi:hypothetical protein
MTLLIETSADRWTRMIRGTGVVGLVSVVLLFAPIIAISSLGEPPFVATSHDQTGAELQTKLGDTAYTAAIDRGRSLTVLQLTSAELRQLGLLPSQG